MPELRVQVESWPIRGGFAISRGTKTAADVVLVELRDGDCIGRGECVPYAHFGESIDAVVVQIESLRATLRRGMDRRQLQGRLPAGAARNAVDCAFWDLEAKRSGCRAWELVDLPPPHPLTTAYTLSLDTAEAMQRAAAANADRPLLKLKLGGDGDLERVRAVRSGAPRSRLIVDANEGWDVDHYRRLVPELSALGVEMIEQPLPADADAPLEGLPRPVPICADESCRTVDSLRHLVGRYDMINIKLDKTGGLSEAFDLRRAAEAAGLGIMVGSMLATSLAMAPAMLLAQGVAVVDLDGPLLLEHDRAPGLRFDHDRVHPPERELWG